MSLLQIQGVSKLYRAGGLSTGLTPALRQVSFDIGAGEVVTLIGESGSGKTTLGRIVLRLISPTSGTITFEGTDIATLDRGGLRDYYRHVQGVFQDPFSSYNPIYKADRVFDLIHREYFAHMPRAAWDAKIESALEAVALNPDDVLNKFPHQLSGGQQQRLLIARALLLDTKLLVADEVISMLDASTRVDVLNLLVSLKRTGMAILFITHDLSLGNYVSDRTVILRRGAIAEIGPTPRVFGNPQHPYTKMLLTAVPELRKKWQPNAAVPSANGQASDRAPEITAKLSGTGASALPSADGEVTGPDRARAHLAGRAFPRPAGPGRRSQSSVPPAPVLTECEPGHLVAEADV